MEGASDERLMRLALDLAQARRGRTSPNPSVGAVIVRRGRVVGRGAHQAAGRAHAEIEALRKAGARARGATLYVTLEPCAHYGRTGPCCDAIMAAGIARVVIGTRDPNPMTDGRGMARLTRAGIRVTTGMLEGEAQELIAPFCKALTSGLPLVIAKVGQSLDGKIATARGESRWITSSPSRRLAHILRRQADAVLVGVNTVLRDDPLLSARVGRRVAGRPIKVIVDSRLRTPRRARCLSAQSPAPTIIATTPRASARKSAAFSRRGVEVRVFKSRNGRVPLRSLCRQLVRRGIHAVLIEGGGEVLASAFAQRLVDRVAWFIAPVLIGGVRAPSALGGTGIERLSRAVRLKGLRVRRVGPDLCVEARVAYPGRRRGTREPGRGKD